MSALVFACFTLLPSSFCLPALAGTVRTVDGNTYSGDVRLDTGGLLVITPADGSGIQKLDLAEVLHATLGNPSTAAATAITASSKTAAAPAAAPYHTENNQLPTPWTTTDVGTLSEKGYAKFTNEGQVFSIKSAGGNIGDADDDAFCFVNQPVTGDFDLIARTTTVGDPKVTQGLMLRAGPDPGATYITIFYVAGDIRFFKRTRTDEATQAGTVGEARSPLPVTKCDSPPRRYDLRRLVPRRRKPGNPSAAKTSPCAWPLAGIACCGRGKQLLARAHVTNLQLTKVAPASAAPETETTAPQPIREGLTFRSGTHLAGAQIEKPTMRPSPSPRATAKAPSPSPASPASSTASCHPTSPPKSPSSAPASCSKKATSSKAHSKVCKRAASNSPPYSSASPNSSRAKGGRLNHQ